MKNILWTVSAAAAIAVVTAGAAMADGVNYAYTTFSISGALDTGAYGIDGSTVVGNYTAADGSGHGFSQTEGVCTTLDHPDAKAGATYVKGVSGNTVVGYYEDNTDKDNPDIVPNFHGFSVTNGVYTTLDVAGAKPRSMRVNSISGNTIVGTYGDASTNCYRGFSYSDGVYTTLNVPGAKATSAYGVSGSTIVGNYETDEGIFHGFSLTDGVYTTLDVPGAMQQSFQGVSGSTAVGYYMDGLTLHGFSETGGVYTTLDAPGALATVIFGISGNTIVGAAYDSEGSPYSYIATAGAPVPEPAFFQMGALLGMSGLGCLKLRRKA